jgi:hypothetical protein
MSLTPSHSLSGHLHNQGVEVKGRCKMQDGRWKMEDGRWRMKDDRCKMEDERWKTKNKILKNRELSNERT